MEGVFHVILQRTRLKENHWLRSSVLPTDPKKWWMHSRSQILLQEIIEEILNLSFIFFKLEAVCRGLEIPSFLSADCLHGNVLDTGGKTGRRHSYPPSREHIEASNIYINQYSTRYIRIREIFQMTSKANLVAWVDRKV